MKTTLWLLAVLVVALLWAPGPGPEPAPDRPPAPAGVPVSSPDIGSVQLPRAIPDTVRPVLTDTVRVEAGGDLQDALDDAEAGTLILLEPGSRFRGPFRLPKRRDSGWVVLRTDLRMEGRIDTTANLATLSAGGTNPRTVWIAPGASGWRLEAVEVTLHPDAEGTNAIVYAHDGGTDVPRRVVLDQVYVHTAGIEQSVKRCVLGNAAGLAILRSVLAGCHSRFDQAQGLAVWNSPGPFLVYDSYVSGSGQAVIFGGADPADSTMIPADVTIRRSHLHWPTSWIGRGFPHVATLETKAVRRLLVDSTVVAGGVQGVLLKSTNQNGSCPACGTVDAAIRRSVVRNVAHAFRLARVGDNPDSRPLQDVLVEDVVVAQLGPTSDFAHIDQSGRTLMLLGPPLNVSVRGFTSLNQGWTAMTIAGSAPGGELAVSDVLVGNGRYGFRLEDAGSLSDLFGPVTWEDVHAVGADCRYWPPGTRCLGSASDIPTGAGADGATVGGAVEDVVR